MPRLLVDEKLLETESMRFLCQLFDKSTGLTEPNFDRYEIFKSLEVDTYEEVKRVTDEIVQYLWIYGLIDKVDNNKVTITRKGEKKCEISCSKILNSLSL